MDKNIILIFFILITNMLSVFAQPDLIGEPLSPEDREQNIQKALQFRKTENYSAAIEKLNVILAMQSDDAPILMLKGDLHLQNKQFAQAVNTLKILLPLNYESTTVRINLSYALFMDNKAATALTYAAAAWQQDSTNTYAVVNYFNAMLWNLKTKAAATFLERQTLALREDQLLVMKARLYTTSGDYRKGLEYYNTLNTEFSDKHYAREYLEVLLGKKEIHQALTVLDTSKELFSHLEYDVIKNQIHSAQVQNAGTQLVTFNDIAKNRRTEVSAWWQQDEGLKYRIGVRMGISNLTSEQQKQTRSQFATINIDEKWNMAWSGRTTLTFQNISFSEQGKFTTITGKQSLQYQPNDRRMFGVFYGTDILNYTATLLEKKIRSHSVGYVTHLLLDGKNGFYSQGSYASISDENEAFQFFGSLYHLFNSEPLLKTGINLSGLHFKDSSITTYFSPDQYLSTEIFAEYNNALPGLRKINLNAQVAAGMQKIERKEWNSAFRLQLELRYKIKNFESQFKYQTSNVASSSGAGYKFGSVTYGLIWKW